MKNTELWLCCGVLFFFSCSSNLFSVDQPADGSNDFHENSYSINKIFSREERAQRYSKFHGAVKTNTTFVIAPSDSAWKELDMDLLIAKLDRTVTAAGSVEFKKLMRPLSDRDELLLRQELVNALLKNQETYDQLVACLSHFSQYENSFINVLEPLVFDPLEMIRQNIIIPVSSSTKLNLLFQLGMMGVGIVSGTMYDALHVQQDWQQMRAGRWGQRLWLGANNAATIYIMGYSLYHSAYSVKNLLAQIPQADDLVLNIGRGIVLTRKMSDLLNANSDFMSSEIAQLFSDVFQKSSLYLQKIIHAIIERERLERSAQESYISTAQKYWSMPDSLDVWYQLKSMRQMFLHMLHAIGVLDAHISIVRLYHEWEKQGTPIAFATYENSNVPHHDFTQLYNALIDSSVANDFMLGGNLNAHHELLTGPHACGKTTRMKTLAYGYILGQTLTVVPAQEAHFVPLTKIKTYFNIGDNLAKGLSSFTAEHGCLDQLLHEANDLELHDRCLMLVDEPLAKTIQIIGEPRVTNFIKTLLPVSQLMLIVATHFEDPVRLEDETNGFIKNMQPEVQVLARNQFKSTFKIISGKADWWFHDKQKREAFVNWLLRK